MRDRAAGRALLTVFGTAVLAACNGGGGEDSATVAGTANSPAVAWPLDGYVTLDRLPEPTDPHLADGGKIWAGTCIRCHGLGTAGAPKITDVAAWAPRIAQGKDVLYAHAIGGLIGPDGSMMPERGGNPDLTDDEIKAAIDFMVANSQTKGEQ